MSRPKPISTGELIVGNDNAGDWRGCVLIVSEAHSWGGVTAYVKVPYKGKAYVRLRKESFTRLHIKIKEESE